MAAIAQVALAVLFMAIAASQPYSAMNGGSYTPISSASASPSFSLPMQQSPQLLPASSNGIQFVQVHWLTPSSLFSAQSTIRVRVAVKSRFELFLNGEQVGSSEDDSAWTQQSEFILSVKDGDVVAVHGNNKKGRYAGMNVQIEYLSGPNQGARHDTADGWICTWHRPKDEEWKMRGFTNTGSAYGMIRRLEPATKHGEPDGWVRGLLGQGSAVAGGEWFWTAHNFIARHAWCRLVLEPRTVAPSQDAQ